MNDKLQLARAYLTDGRYTCVLLNDTTVLTTVKRGVQPLMEWVLSQTDFHGFVAADRVVGKAAAFLYVLLGVQAVWAEVVSRPAEEVFRRWGIALEYGASVEAIRNRAGDGFCPMEQAVWGIDDPKQAWDAIEKTYQALTKKDSL